MAGSVVVVGGGIMGSAVARFLAHDHAIDVTLLERDLSFARASSALSASSIRQQFGSPVNVALSRWSFDFLRRAETELAIGTERPAIGLVERGYLYLAGPAGATALREVHALQRSAGAEVDLLDAAALGARFPWLATADIALGSVGTSHEGWFDGPALHLAFLRQARALGVRVLAVDAVSFDTHGSRVVAVRGVDGQSFTADAFVLCAGAWSGSLAGRLGVDLPVSARKRDVFVFETPAQLPGCPLVIDPSGVWFRPEGRGYITGAPPRAAADGGPGDPDEPPLEAIDHELFDAVIWPTLAARVPHLETLRVNTAWGGYYEMNQFDHNGLAGPLPGWSNAWTACGFSGHGMQQAPAVACALAGQVAGATVAAPSLDALTPARIRTGQPLRESQII